MRWWNTRFASKAPDLDSITVDDLQSIGRDFLAEFGELGPTMWDAALGTALVAAADGIDALPLPPEPSEHQARKLAENMDEELKSNPDLLRDPFAEQQRLDLQHIIQEGDRQDTLVDGNDAPPDMPEHFPAPEGSEAVQLEARMKADNDSWWHPDNQASRDRFNKLHGADAWRSGAPVPEPERQPRPARWWDPAATTSIEEEMTTNE